MGFYRFILPLMLIVACCSNKHDQQEKIVMDDTWSNDIDAVKHARVFFGHQSVGWNIVEGMTRAAAGVNGVRIVRADSVMLTDSTYFAHGTIGTNGEPKTKCDAFVSEVDRLQGNSLQVALMKFCFADFVPETDVTELFKYYVASVEKLRSRYPHIRIVHMTAPLLRKSPLWKRVIKWILSRPENSELQNLKVNSYNKLLLNRFANEPIFDLALLESTAPDGSRCMVEDGPNPIYTVVPEYTSDGGHLNELGSRLAALEMIRVLANTLRAGLSGKGN